MNEQTYAPLKREQTNCKDGGWEGWVQKTGKAMKTKQNRKKTTTTKTLQNFGHTNLFIVSRRPGQYSVSILEKT